jgi:uncharacterized protein YbjT (DUF2867 family)
MRIAIAGVSGLVGSALARAAQAAGHEVVGLSKESGTDVLQPAGLADALAGAEALVDVVQSPTLDEAGASAFFTGHGPGSTPLRRTSLSGTITHMSCSMPAADAAMLSGAIRDKNSRSHTPSAAGASATPDPADDSRPASRSVHSRITAGSVGRVSRLTTTYATALTARPA